LALCTDRALPTQLTMTADNDTVNMRLLTDCEDETQSLHHAEDDAFNWLKTRTATNLVQ